MTHIPKRLIEATDRLYWSPEERAQGVHNIIGEALKKVTEAHPDDHPTDWDVMCWAAEFCGFVSQAIGNEELLQAAKNLLTVLYSIHYSNASTLYGPPDKQKEKEVN